ncbi:MAG: hypothetical protein IKY26_07580 [Erysipelotrichaceae bacterium]|nr:hypothetical protein [Erysipelotrichaceae bacterium]
MHMSDMSYYSVTTSMKMAINEFRQEHGYLPGTIFMSRSLFLFMNRHCRQKMQDSFEGIRIAIYDDTKFEYYLAEKKGTFYDVDYDVIKDEVVLHEV